MAGVLWANYPQEARDVQEQVQRESDRPDPEAGGRRPVGQGCLLGVGDI